MGKSKPSRTSAKNFSDEVRRVVSAIPAGQTRSYGEVARLAGNPRAARAVGAVMRRNFDPKIPCHRVVSADGCPGGYNRGGPEAKRRILAREARTC